MRLLLVTLVTAMLVSAATAAVPRVELERMRAVAPYVVLPTRLPAGVVFVRWSPKDLLPTTCGRALHVSYAVNPARTLEWSTARACDSGGRLHCNRSGYAVDRRERLHGRTVYFSRGNHGSDAWTCIRVRGELVELHLWESNFLSPSAAMTVVALAR